MCTFCYYLFTLKNRVTKSILVTDKLSHSQSAKCMDFVNIRSVSDNNIDFHYNTQPNLAVTQSG